jgi:hypothetical protein
MREPAEVAGCFLARLADHRHAQAAADHAGDVAERYALFGEPVIPRSLEYSAFAVDGRPDLSMVIYNPATPADADRIRSLI